MGQCCSSKQHLKKKTSKKNTKNVSTLTIHHSFYEDNYLTPYKPVHHLFSLPAQATPLQSTDALVNRDVFEALVAHFCNCSYSTRCPHRPQITPVRRQGYRRYSEQDANPRPVPARPRRITAPSYPSRGPFNYQDLHLPKQRPLSEVSDMGAPIHSSTLLADHEDSCHIHQIGLSGSDDRYQAELEGTQMDETLPSFDLESSFDDVYGYKFQPQKQLSEIEKSVIWV